MNCTVDRRSGGHVSGSGPIKREGRTFVSDRNALNTGRLAIPLTDIGGGSHYGRMESESELISLPPSFEHVDSDHLCRLIGRSSLLSLPTETRLLRMAG